MSKNRRDHTQQQDKDILDNYRHRQQLMDLLALASAYEPRGEFGDSRYTFTTATRTAVLDYNWHDGDTRLRITINGQSEPVLDVELRTCRDIRPIRDERRQGLEFIGKAPVPRVFHFDYDHNAGMRLYLTPDISVEPFWCFDKDRPGP